MVKSIEELTLHHDPGNARHCVLTETACFPDLQFLFHSIFYMIA